MFCNTILWRNDKMKKTIRVVVLTLAVLSVFSLFTACKAKEDAYERIVSEYRSEVYTGENDKYSIETVSGYRENPFEIDGKSGSKVDYTLIIVTPKIDTAEKSLVITADCDGKKTEGNALRHPYKDSYSFEFMSKTTCDKPLITISDGNTSQTITLSPVRKEGEISGIDAMKKVVKNLSDSLAPYTSDGKFCGEIFIRYISNPLSSDGKYYWYVSFVPEADSSKTIAVLVDVVSGEIIASRK